MEGFLNKKGRGQTVSFIRPWTRRYFVLDEERRELRYYEGENQRRCRGRLALVGVQVFEAQHSDKKFSFEVRVEQEHGVVLLDAPDAATKDKWMKALLRLSNSEVRESLLQPGECGTMR